MIFRFSFPCRPPGLRRCLSNHSWDCLRLHCTFFDHGVKSPRHAGGGGDDVRWLHRLVADCSRHRWNPSSRFCELSAIWITTSVQLRTRSLGSRTRRRRRKPHILTYPVIFDQRRNERAHVAITYAWLSRCGYLWLLGCVIIRQSLGQQVVCQHWSLQKIPQGEQDRHRDKPLLEQHR